MWFIFSVGRSLPSDSFELASLEEATPFIAHTTNKSKDDQRDRGPMSQALAILTFFQRILIVLFCLVACAQALLRIRIKLATSLVGPVQSAVVPHQLVLLSAHLGPKFFGLQSVLTLNKVRFAEMNNMSLYLAEDFYQQNR